MTLRKILTCLFPLLSSCAGHHVERTVVYENSVYHWRIEHVVDHYFPAGDRQYYEVFLDDRLLIIPAKTFNDDRDIRSFIAAGGFDVGHWRNKSIIVCFENIQQRDGQEHRLIRSLMISPEHGEEVLLTDLYTQQQVVVDRG
ncbi:hypothetical protein SAMN05216588_13117 [Pseudomonas flavescens]|uniref:Uncharacterized protein n=1 Tax=Phytopseudomonas flavescens TaxID=29435 RepID=A0A1G8PWZ6_9GAMM|nr:hypothetical protein [Pseudomonas flavescens]SDI96370.1 hypothetical protein SAMN05216588_13117 [Pseudomonas flavescens]